MTTRTSLDELLSRPGRVLGTWTQIASGDVIDALGHAGFDFTIIDCEHGAFGIETAENLIRMCEANGVAPLVRVPRGDLTAIYKALDAGAAGVLVPSVESVEEADRAIAMSMFAPVGTRGACPIVRSARHSAMAWREFTARQARNGIVLMIETRKGVDACEAICKLSGLKALLIGPFDLSVSMGLQGDYQHSDVMAAIHRLIAAARGSNVPVIMPVFAPEEKELRAQIQQWTAQGIRHFAIGADKIIVTRAFGRYRAWAAA